MNPRDARLQRGLASFSQHYLFFAEAAVSSSSSPLFCLPCARPSTRLSGRGARILALAGLPGLAGIWGWLPTQGRCGLVVALAGGLDTAIFTHCLLVGLLGNCRVEQHRNRLYQLYRKQYVELIWVRSDSFWRRVWWFLRETKFF